MSIEGRITKSSLNNPCPVCGRTKDSDCRILEDGTVWCHTHAGARKFELINGYRCIKESSNHTASFKLDNWQSKDFRWTEQQKADYKAARAAREASLAQKKAEAEKLRLAKIARELPADQRHHYINLLLDELTLNDDDKQHLLGRGFTLEQIEKDKYRSVTRRYKPSVELPKNFPGLLQDGSLCISSSGILVPIWNDNLIVGLNLHDRNAEKKGNKYRKVSCPDNSEHLNGEIPVGAFFPDKECTYVYLPEGGGYKARLASWKHGIATIAASGGQFASSPKNCRDTIEAAKHKYGLDITLVLVPDAGDPVNKNVIQRHRKQIVFLRSIGYEPKIAWWNQRTKNEDDIDELSSIDNIQYLTPEEYFNFISVTEMKPQALPQFEESKANLEAKLQSQTEVKADLSTIKLEEISIEPERDWAFENYIKSRNFTHDILIELEDGEDFSWYHPKLKHLNWHNLAVFLKGDMGIGKTIANILLSCRQNYGTYWLGYINNLLLQIISRAIEQELKIYHLHNENAFGLTSDVYSHIAFCIDSIQHTFSHAKGRTIIADEICSTSDSVLSAGTVGDRQGEVMSMMTTAIVECNNFVATDANLTNIDVEHYSSLCSDKEVVRIRVVRKNRVRKNFILSRSVDENGEIKVNDKSGIIEDIKNNISWFTSDSREFLKRLDEILKHQGNMLHKETANESWAKEFLSNPNEYIRRVKPKYQGLSPTGGAGISYTDSGHFTKQYHFCFGVTSINAAIQRTGRNRDTTIENIVVIPEVSMIKNRNRPGNYSARMYEAAIKAKEALAASLCLVDAKEFLEKAKARKDERWELYDVRKAVIDNYEQANYRKCFEYVLKEECGHNVTYQDVLINAEVKEEEKLAKEVVQRNDAEKLYKAEEFENTLEADSVVKKNPSPENYVRKNKTYLLDILPGIKEEKIWDTEFIYQCYLKDNHYINQIQNDWMLSNFEISQLKHTDRFFKQITKENPTTSKTSNSPHLAIWALHELGIKRLDNLSEFHKETPEIIGIVDRYKQNKKLQLALDIKLPKNKKDGDDRIEIINRMLSKIGKKCQFKYRKVDKSTNGMQLRFYKVENIDYEINDISSRKVITECIERKWLNWKKDRDIKSELELREKHELLKIEQEKNDKLLQEFTEAASNTKNAEWLTEESIKDTAELLDACDDVETFQSISQIIPSFALKAALSTLEQKKIDDLCMFGAERVPKDAYEVWIFCR